MWLVDSFMLQFLTSLELSKMYKFPISFLLLSCYDITPNVTLTLLKLEEPTNMHMYVLK